MIFVLGAAILGAGMWLRHQQQASLPALLTHLPSQEAVYGYVSVEALRASGLLKPNAKPNTREPEYEAFIAKSGFNWEKDMDSVLWSSTKDGRFFFVTGHFDWDQLEKFVAQEGGECRDSFCTLAGSVPDRQISFFPWRTNVMAMAVSPDRYAADRMRIEYRYLLEPPASPFWIHASPNSLKGSVPESPGLRVFARLLEHAKDATLYLDAGKEPFSLQLRAQCENQEQAEKLRDGLTKGTEWLKTLLRMEDQTPTGTDVAGVLSKGSFAAKQSTVEGVWPIPREFLAQLIAEE